MRRARWRIGYLLGVVLGLALPLPLPAQEQGSGLERFLAAIKKAEAFQKGGNLAEAIEQYEEAGALAVESRGPADVTTGEVTCLLANACADAGQYAKAETLFL